MSIVQHGSLKKCLPCKAQNPTHLDCADPRGEDRECFCWAASWVHRSKWAIPAMADDERDHEHDRGADEFDTWIARSDIEYDD